MAAQAAVRHCRPAAGLRRRLRRDADHPGSPRSAGPGGRGARRDRLDREIEALAADSMFTPVVTRLGCLRGVSTLTAFGLAAEIGDWGRLTGRSIGAYLGLVPTEYSSGSTRVQGGVTKTGNSHARRLLIEAAWHHRARS